MKTKNECYDSTELDENFKLKEYIKQGIFFTGLPILYFTTTICIIKKLRARSHISRGTKIEVNSIELSTNFKPPKLLVQFRIRTKK